MGGRSKLWAIVLAGGEGVRLRPLVSRIHSDGRPKQFAVLVGSRSLLRQTLDRVAVVVPPERTVVVTTKAHAPFYTTELSGADAPRALVQPYDRGTAAGILLPTHWIARHESTATVAVFPSDHFIADDVGFMRHIEELAAAAERLPNRMFLVGIEPESAETGYGWIEPGAEMERTSYGAIRLVERFWEKPSPEVARACFQRGCLWNTLVIVAKAATIIEAGRRVLPQLHERLTRIAPFIDTEGETRAVDRAYTFAPAADFSRTVLAARSSMLAVSTLPRMAWSDWGTPERVIETLQRQGIVPSWPAELATTA